MMGCVFLFILFCFWKPLKNQLDPLPGQDQFYFSGILVQVQFTVQYDEQCVSVSNTRAHTYGLLCVDELKRNQTNHKLIRILRSGACAMCFRIENVLIFIIVFYFFIFLTDVSHMDVSISGTCHVFCSVIVTVGRGAIDELSFRYPTTAIFYTHISHTPHRAKQLISINIIDV